MPLRLTGSYRLKLDGKGRISIPIEIRRQIEAEKLGTAFYFNVGLNERIWGYPSASYEAWLDLVPRNMNPEEPEMEYRLLQSSAMKTPWDEQGRVVVPDDLRAQINVGDDVALVGSIDHVELWRYSEWTEHRAKLWKSAPSVVKKWKESAKPAAAASGGESPGKAAETAV